VSTHNGLSGTVNIVLRIVARLGRSATVKLRAMTHRLLPLVLIPAIFIFGACSDDGRDMKIPAGNQNESIMTTTLPDEGDASFETPAP
jgi:hypothetical protein